MFISKNFIWLNYCNRYMYNTLSILIETSSFANLCWWQNFITCSCLFWRKCQRRTEKGVSGWDRTNEASGKAPKCPKFSWLLDHNDTTASDHWVHSSWRLASLAKAQEKSGNSICFHSPMIKLYSVGLLWDPKSTIRTSYSILVQL